MQTGEEGLSLALRCHFFRLSLAALKCPFPRVSLGLGFTSLGFLGIGLGLHFFRVFLGLV